jgi:hypothetical protein
MSKNMPISATTHRLLTDFMLSSKKLLLHCGSLYAPGGNPVGSKGTILVRSQKSESCAGAIETRHR